MKELRMADRRFPRAARLRRQADFARVHAANVFAADDMLVIKGSLNDSTLTRIGISISRQVGNAVVRNRWKRLVREAFRHSSDQLPRGLDLVIRPRRGAQPERQAIERSLRRLTAKVAHKLAAER